MYIKSKTISIKYIFWDVLFLQAIGATASAESENNCYISYWICVMYTKWYASTKGKFGNILLGNVSLLFLVITIEVYSRHNINFGYDQALKSKVTAFKRLKRIIYIFKILFEYLFLILNGHCVALNQEF